MNAMEKHLSPMMGKRVRLDNANDDGQLMSPITTVGAPRASASFTRQNSFDEDWGAKNAPGQDGSKAPGSATSHVRKPSQTLDGGMGIVAHLRQPSQPLGGGATFAAPSTPPGNHVRGPSQPFAAESMASLEDAIDLKYVLTGELTCVSPMHDTASKES
mmetsp:Transcript_22518/g.69779  ORF Transcript_22518/g.69779 Transcript_22518/m.69779 type:complete len:159 (-) Transcript_22518:469-945(-)|eukprot:CAMPEP_0118850268 /NCGR_PEP_ID=MMETSP1163-20130328/204_1 /TAXON_ID=124430 /ORGANISM="Phaeomonas parva, Strain CCMP2877" /LENGTH=158 /DNA_ID=CAMNT_0006782469 /DNA_START=215 /DNA_END=691 /DNA_ORIENTATION=-